MQIYCFDQIIGSMVLKDVSTIFSTQTAIEITYEEGTYLIKIIYLV